MQTGTNPTRAHHQGATVIRQLQDCKPLIAWVCCRLMEPAMAEYYRGFSYEHIMAHREEACPVRTEFLQGKGEDSLQWILRKYEIEEPIRTVDILDGSKKADDATVLPTAATGGVVAAEGLGVDGEVVSGVFQTVERDDGLGCKGDDKRWMPPGAKGKPMSWATPSKAFTRGGVDDSKGSGGSDKTWMPPGR